MKIQIVRSPRRILLALSLSVTSLVAFMGLAPLNFPKNPSALSKSIKNWGLFNTSAKSHIQALDAWKLEEGSPQVVVAVIDTGIDPKHSALKSNLWKDPKSASLGVYGWNFVTNTSNPIDQHGHGTHVAGIIGAVTDPKNGASGVAKHVSIMAVKYYEDGNTGAVNLKNTVKAINYAVEHGAKIINYSGGGPEFSEDEYLAIKKAEAKGVLFVAAAGNEHQDIDQVENYYYPSAYRLSNMISVAATDIKNQLLSTSNWGKTKVDVTAPGENIYSTLPGNRFGHMSGTSQATAFVTGAAVLLLSKNPTLTPKQIRELLIQSVDRFPHLHGKILAGGRINAYSALLALTQPGQKESPFSPVATRTVFNFLAATPNFGE